MTQQQRGAAPESAATDFANAARLMKLNPDDAGNWPAIAAKAGLVPPALTDRETAYGTTVRLSFQIKVF